MSRTECGINTIPQHVMMMSVVQIALGVKYGFDHQGSKKVQKLLMSRSHWFQDAQVALTEPLEAFYWTGNSLSATGLTNLGLQFLQVLFNTIIKRRSTHSQKGVQTLHKSLQCQ